MSGVIVAAGSGERMKGSELKQFLPIHERPILAHTLKKFEDCDEIDQVVVVVPPEKVSYCQTEIVEKYGFEKVIGCVRGGRERQDSAYNGIIEAGGEIICVHDGVRPAVTPSLISRCVVSARSFGAAIAAVPVRDTIKRVVDEGVVATLKRNELWEVQTPQAFRRELLLAAFEKAIDENFVGTDESSLVERMGERVHVVMGDYRNLKVTCDEDLRLIEPLIEGSW